MAHYAKYCQRCHDDPLRTFEQHLVECRGVTDHPALPQKKPKRPSSKPATPATKRQRRLF